MQKNVRRLSVLALLVGLAVAAPVAAAPPASPSAREDPSKVDLRALEKQILVEYNNVRTNPKGFAAILSTMKQQGSSSGGDIRIVYDDSSPETMPPYYLDSGIATAQTIQPLTPYIWSDGLAQAARNYAEKSPRGHFDFGTTLGSRLAEVGASQEGTAESINFFGTTALTQLESLYIDNGNPGLGHRNMVINPNITHMGIGCALNTDKDITCVLDAAIGWTEQTNMPNFEVGKQYAFLGPDNTFEYVKLTQVRDGLPSRVDLCPNPPNSGWINLGGAGDLTSPEAALAKSLTAKNQPCDQSTTPNGVLNNGTSLPILPAQDAGPAATATSVPAQPAGTTTSAPPAVTAATAATATSVTAPPAATATSAPPAATATSATSSTTPTAINPGGNNNLVITINDLGKTFAIRGANNTFQYVRLTHIRNATTYEFDPCPNPAVNGSINIDKADANYVNVMTVDTALAQNLTPQNQPCAAPTAPLNIVLGKMYALRGANNTFQYIRVDHMRNGPAYEYDFCPNPAVLGPYYISPGDANFPNLMTVQSAQLQNLNATNAPCSPQVAQPGT